MLQQVYLLTEFNPHSTWAVLLRFVKYYLVGREKDKKLNPRHNAPTYKPGQVSTGVSNI